MGELGKKEKKEHFIGGNFVVTSSNGKTLGKNVTEKFNVTATTLATSNCIFVFNIVGLGTCLTMQMIW